MQLQAPLGAASRPAACKRRARQNQRHQRLILIDFRRGHKIEPGASRYDRLLARRLLSGLLELFYCARCSRAALDALGWDGRRKPLCADCAEGRPL